MHTIVRLPSGVFNPYTSIKTNLLFFQKGKTTKEIWFYKMPYPDGIKSFNRTRPIEIGHFESIKKWWNKRKESEDAWKVNISEVKKNNYNLDYRKSPKKDEILNRTTKETLKDLNSSLKRSQRILKDLSNLINNED